jgi:class 3 adenylate cyclase
MYRVPLELLQPSRPYADLLRYLAEHGYYGDGDVEAHVARRVESLRNPTGQSFEDRTPDGRIYRIRRRRAAGGGAVTVMTDITEQKEAELELLEAKRQTEEANQRVTEQNLVLEGLASKLAKYLSPQIYQSIFSGRQTVEISAKRKKLTIFFSDIKDFTEMSERLQPEELTSLLNEYLTEMSQIALFHGGTIDKFIGDAMLVFFGDPETKGIAEDAKACLMMAVDMQRRLHELNALWRQRGIELPFRARMGINTGYCNVGNFGSVDRMDYTIIGAEANLAARLQSIAEPNGIVLSYEAYSHVRDLIRAKPLAPISMKGIARPVVPYAVEGLLGELTQRTRVISEHETGIDVFVDLDVIDRETAARTIKALQAALDALDAKTAGAPTAG